MLSMRLIRSRWLLSALLCLCIASPLRCADSKASVCAADPASALAFVGTLTELTPERTPSSGWKAATFVVNEALLGPKSTTVSALMLEHLCGESGPAPTVGRAYLVQTHVSPKGDVNQLEHCEQVRPVEQASAALEYLRSSQGGITPTEVAGEARVETRGYPWKKIPLPKTKVHLAGAADRQSDFVSDEDGQFHGTLRPGRYAITIEFPTGYETEYCSPPAITVVEHRCTQISVCAHSTASIKAHIVDAAGEPLGPLSNVQLTLETAEDQQFVQSVWPDEHSDLKVENLLPGQYILGLNTYLPVGRGFAPYPPTYFPGVSRRSKAQVIDVAVGEHKLMSEMRIMKGKECDIPVFVSDALGKPSPSTGVALAYSDYPHFYLDRNPTDENGRQTIYAVFPGPVWLRAEKQQRDGSTVQSENVELNSCPTESVSLKLSRVVVDRAESKKK